MLWNSVETPDTNKINFIVASKITETNIESNFLKLFYHWTEIEYLK